VEEKAAAVADRRTSITSFLALPRYIRRNHGQNEVLMRPIAGYDLESVEEALLPAPQLSLPAPTPMPKKRKARDEAPAPASAGPSSLPPARRSKRGQDYLDACPTIIKTPSGNWVELRCPECNGNTEPQKGGFYKGPAGLQKHLQTNHEMKLSPADTITRCWHRVVPDSEVEKIVSGEVEMERVMGVGKGKVAPVKNGKGGGGGEKARAAALEDDEEAEGVEEESVVGGDGAVEKEEEDEIVRPSDSLPSSEVNRARLADFRKLQERYFN
jgi:hypothetical protein